MRIETLINQLLSLDSNTTPYLKKLQGKSLEIIILTVEKTFFVSFTKTGINLTFVKPTVIDVIIQGPIKAFINLAITKNPHQSAQLGLSFEGDFSTVETVQQLFLFLDIDWEEVLSFWTGDIIAHQVGQFAHYTKKRNAALLENTTKSISEYLQEEAAILPTRIEVNHFMDKIDLLRADTDRLEARLEQCFGIIP
jgi:ubiquinone biosynthesis accessory factor UbiJ